MGLAYSLKCSLICSCFYSLAPLLSFSFSHVLAPRVSLIPPGHIASGTLHHSFRSDISHPEFFPAAIPLGHLASGILHRSFRPDVLYPEFFSADIPPGYITSEISFRWHSTRTEILTHSTRIFTAATLSGQHSALSGCLTSESEGQFLSTSWP